MAQRRNSHRVVEVVDFDSQWHLDRRVPIALIVTILIQAGGILAWGNGITSDVASMQRDIGELKSESTSRTTKLDQLIRVEERLQYVVESQARLERAIERLTRDGDEEKRSR